MNIKHLNEQLHKLFEQHILSSTKTKQQAIRKIYNNVDTRGIFHDEAWAKVDEIVEDIENLGAYVLCRPTNSTLYQNGYPTTGNMDAKSYDLEIHFTNALDKEIVIYGRILCSGCGTVSDPLSAYDVNLTLS